MAKHKRSKHAKNKKSLVTAAALTSGVLAAAGGGAIASASPAVADDSPSSSTQAISDSLFGFGAFVPSLLGLTPQGGTPYSPDLYENPDSR
ncbi:hypothetical protein ABQF26_34825, partial [Mycolicibacterium elephantis]